MEDRARRFAQPSTLAEPQTAKTAVKRLSSDTLINSSAAPLVKQAKIMASRKVVAKANFVQQRKEQLNRVQQQQPNMQAAAQLRASVRQQAVEDQQNTSVAPSVSSLFVDTNFKL